MRECLNFADDKGFTVDSQCIVKEPYTATTMDRPLVESLLADMARRGIRHLIMDKPDRVNRSGQQDAAYFMRRLWESDVTLSFALINFTIRPGNELAQSMFLNYALFAKLDNDQRVANVQRTRREAARSLGRYVKGNRPPYGWQLQAAQLDSHGQAVTFRLVHDDAPGGTYPILERILRERQAGLSYMRIASGLTADHVPTSAATAGLRNTSLTRPWSGSSVKIIVHDPINAGLVTAFRSRTVIRPPDARHPRRWKSQEPIPLSEQIMLPSDLVVDPPLTPEQYRWLISPAAYALRSDGSARVVPQGGSAGGKRGRSKAADLAVGHGGLFRHAACGGTVRVNWSAPGKTYTYYSCQRHADVRERCPGGFSILAPTLDSLVWDAVVREVLLVPGKLEELAEEQRQADTAGDDPQSEVRRKRQMHSELLKDQESLLDSVAHARDAYVRRLAEQRLAEIGPQIEEAEANLADAEQRSANEDQRRAVLKDVEAQVLRHKLLLTVASALPTPARVSFQRRVLRALGFQATVDKTADGLLDVAAELRLAAGQPGLWFVAEDEQRQWNAALAEVIRRGLREDAWDPHEVLPDLGGAQDMETMLARAHEGWDHRLFKPREPGQSAPAAAGQVRFVTMTSSPCP